MSGMGSRAGWGWAAVLLSAGWAVSAASGAEPLRMVVMDPLAAPLSCPCVEGYAQRKYERLAEHLEQRLERPVELVFAESLAKALKETKGRADLIVGKDSVVRSDARKAKLDVVRVARLTDKTGGVSQHGLIVVAAADKAQKPADLAGYKIYFGPEDSDEKHRAALELLESAGVARPAALEVSDACSDGAGKVVDGKAQGRLAAVISSYAAPLLEGCGTIKKGDLRVVGKTKPVPFIAAFVSKTLPADERGRLAEALLGIGADVELCSALESLVGFVAPEDAAGAPSGAKSTSTTPVRPTADSTQSSTGNSTGAPGAAVGAEQAAKKK